MDQHFELNNEEQKQMDQMEFLDDNLEDDFYRGISVIVQAEEKEEEKIGDAQ